MNIGCFDCRGNRMFRVKHRNVRNVVRKQNARNMLFNIKVTLIMVVFLCFLNTDNFRLSGKHSKCASGTFETRNFYNYSSNLFLHSGKPGGSAQLRGSTMHREHYRHDIVQYRDSTMHREHYRYDRVQYRYSTIHREQYRYDIVQYRDSTIHREQYRYDIVQYRDSTTRYSCSTGFVRTAHPAKRPGCDRRFRNSALRTAIALSQLGASGRTTLVCSSTNNSAFRDRRGGHVFFRDHPSLA